MATNTNEADILKNIKLLALSNLFTEFRLYSPIAIIFFAREAGSFALGMSIFSAITLTQTIFEMPMGAVSDRIGRRKTMVAGSVFLILSVLCFVSGLGYPSLLAGAVCEGLSVTFFSGNNSALLYESLKQAGKDQEFSTYSGKTDSMFQLGLAVSALCGSCIALYLPLTVLFWLTLLPYSLALLVSFFIIEPVIHSERDFPVNNALLHVASSFKACFRNRTLRLLVTSESLSQGIGEVIHHFRPAFIGTVWPLWAIGIHRTLAHTLGFIGYRLSGRLIEKFTAVKVLLVSTTSISFVNFTALFLENMLSPILMALPSMTYGFERTSMKTLQQQEFHDEQRATMGSVSGMIGGLIFALMAVVIGWLADSFGIVMALFLALISMLSVIYLNLRLSRATS